MKAVREFLRGLFLENWGPKVTALCLATMLWVLVVGEKRSEVSLSVPLELLRVPAGIVVVNRLPESVQLRLSGPRTLLAAMGPQELSVALDLSGIQPGVTSFENLGARVRLPKRIEVTYVSPSVITVEADRRVEKKLPVKVRLRGEPAAGYVLAGTRADPPEVLLDGAARVLEALREVPTEVVDISGAEGSLGRPVDLSLPDPTLRILSRGLVVAEVDVEQESGERQFAKVPVSFQSPRWVAKPASVEVVLRGGKATLARLSAEAIRVVVGGLGKNPGREAHRVTVEVPEGLEVVSVKPKAVEVRERQPEPPSLESPPL